MDRRGRNSIVSPISTLVFERASTYQVKEFSEKAKWSVERLDENLLLKGDSRPTFGNSVKSIVSLLMQWRLAGMLLYHLVVSLSVYLQANDSISDLGYGYVDILGWVVGLLVAFRQREGMLRWWQGREMWGKLVSTSRDLVRTILTYNTEKSTSIHFTGYVLAFPVVLKNFLRGDSSNDELELQPLLPEQDVQYILGSAGLDRCLTVLDLLNGAILNMLNCHTLERDCVMHRIDPKIADLNECLSSILRIKTTPLPDTYRVVLNLVVFLFLVSMPFSLLSHSWNPWAVLIVCTMVSVVLQVLIELAEAIEDPFQRNDPIDLPLGRYTADVIASCIHMVDRFYKPNSILHQTKMEQKRQLELHSKLQRAKLKTKIITHLGGKI